MATNILNLTPELTLNVTLNLTPELHHGVHHLFFQVLLRRSTGFASAFLSILRAEPQGCPATLLPLACRNLLASAAASKEHVSKSGDGALGLEVVSDPSSGTSGTSGTSSGSSGNSGTSGTSGAVGGGVGVGVGGGGGGDVLAEDGEAEEAEAAGAETEGERAARKARLSHVRTRVHALNILKMVVQVYPNNIS